MILDPPETAGRKAAALRGRMLDSVSGGDMDDVMQALLRKAKLGDLKAIDLLAQIVGAK